MDCHSPVKAAGNKNPQQRSKTLPKFVTKERNPWLESLHYACNALSRACGLMSYNAMRVLATNQHVSSAWIHSSNIQKLGPKRFLKTLRVFSGVEKQTILEPLQGSFSAHQSLQRAA